MTNYKGGYFILNPSMNSSIEELEYRSKRGFYVTIKDKPEIIEIFLEMIQSAKSYIKICSFILTAPKILRAIENRLEKRDLVVFILTQLDQQKLRSNLLTEEEKKESFSHLDNIATLIELGAHVRAASNVHAKFMLADGVLGYITSVNITTPSFEYNNEFCTRLDSEIDLFNLEYLFDLLYQKGTNYSSFISTGTGRQSVISTNLDFGLLEEHIPSKEDSNLRYTFGDLERNLYDEMINIIERAEEEIIITTYSIVELNKLSELFIALEKFIDEKQGKVKIFCRAMNYRPDHLRGCLEFHQIGCKIWADTYNHSKSIISDKGKEGMVFTANIDGWHGLKNGFEVGCYFGENSIMIQNVYDFAVWQINNAPYIFNDKVSPLDYKLFYNQYCKEKNIKIPQIVPKVELVLNSEEEINNKVREDFLNYPVFFMPGKNDNNQFTITANKSYLEIELRDDGFYILEVLMKKKYGSTYHLAEGLKILNTTNNE